jgi:hypothetical protein
MLHVMASHLVGISVGFPDLQLLASLWARTTCYRDICYRKVHKYIRQYVNIFVVALA